MRSLGLVAVGVIVAIVVVGNLGSMIGLAISLLIAYMGFHYFRKTHSSFKKFFWGVVMAIGVISAVSNIPALIGIAALLLMYYTWRRWKNDNDYEVITDSSDPFENFEREWKNISK